MRFRLVIDPDGEEEVVARVKAPSAFTDQLEAAVMAHSAADRLVGYREDEWRLLCVEEIECITVQDGKTYAVDHKGMQYRLKQRLYELEDILPACFIRINKSALANEKRLERFVASFNGSVDAVFRCGYREYVSRRCFAELKRRYGV